MNLENFNWGPTSEWYKEQITKEMFEENIYEKCFPVEEGDIVVDFGASIGDFIWSIKNKNPKHCFVIEPLNSYFDILQENSMKATFNLIFGVAGGVSRHFSSF